ncbi:MAG: hypothetical protein COX62_04970 [Deltaproteobacteria bacterium CG_4_10_14_0_2_um_filter_43_8]|nr:MAG: hypothetical protein COV43_05470 [Deltaproteobacteria bacterium CG11_big_fil_rev_8_21_14_0_20_42_23]PJA20259.1 MAG: hypothetical protein COX62_04970 [Deltaproteobacteria bacterium CG_4_10_14_0_2_um_filter_43_8]PJC64041.1 MAG: hypothetical protein CO021_06445 [Deltaproteobacteria bacterium CG_4_9_14_0_2_um_filter_42_21]
MSALAYLLLSIAKVLSIVIDLYTYVIIISSLLSWVSPDPSNPIVRILHALTTPVYAFIRRHLPRKLLYLPIDISPLIALLLLVLFENFFIRLLTSYAIRLM